MLCQSDTMSTLGIEKTEAVATYLKALFIAELNSSHDDLGMPKWSLDLLEDCHWAVKVMARAWRNQSEFECP